MRIVRATPLKAVLAGHAEAEVEDVIRLMAPRIERAPEAGVTTLVARSTVGVGRRADIDQAVSEATDFPFLRADGCLP